MPYNAKSNIWPNKDENFFRDRKIKPMKQNGRHCVSTTLAMLTNREPQDFQNHSVNTQDPVDWSNALKKDGMKLAYCPYDVRKLNFYIDELIDLDDLFLLCYYIPIGPEILKDPDESGWVCSSHVVIMHRDKIIDPMGGVVQPAKDHKCNQYYTKRIFRVLPIKHPRGL